MTSGERTRPRGPGTGPKIGFHESMGFQWAELDATLQIRYVRTQVLVHTE